MFVGFRIRRWNLKIREHFRYKLLHYESVNPSIESSLLTESLLIERESLAIGRHRLQRLSLERERESLLIERVS